LPVWVGVRGSSPADHVALVVGELTDHVIDALVALAVGHRLHRLGLVAREQVSQGGLTVLADGLVEACQSATQLAQLGNLVDRDLGRGGDLLVGGVPEQLRAELTLDLAHLDLPLGDVDRYADRPAVILQPALHRLPDPERSVRGELEATPPVELLDCADQAEHALLYEVLHGQPVALVATRLRDDQPQVGIDHAVLGGQVTALDALGQLDLLVGREQGMHPRLAQEQIQRLGRARGGRRLLGSLPRSALSSGRMSGTTLPLTAISGLGIGPRASAARVVGMDVFVVVAAPASGAFATLGLKGVQLNLH
jgi:hypothetical protein